jgi:integrase
LPAQSKLRRAEHNAALPIDEMPEFLGILRQREGMSARALEFAILTAARTGEILGTRCGRFVGEA